MERKINNKKGPRGLLRGGEMTVRPLPPVFDAHVHLRQDELMRLILPYFSHCDAVVAMGNTVPPIWDATSLEKYQEEIGGYGLDFEVIYSIMLVNGTTPHVIEAAYNTGARVLKLIPGGTSTNSGEGVALERLADYYESLKRARELGMIFSIHLELARDKDGKDIPEIDREEAAIPYLKRLVNDIPDLKIVVEHASTATLIEVIKAMPDNVVATLTLHHAMITIDDVMKDGVITNPHHYCKPIAKTEEDMRAVINAMTSGNPKFFFGSDSAAHLDEKKLAQSPAAGIFSAPIVVPALYQIFVNMGKEEHFDGFIGTYGARFYGLSMTKKSEDEIVEIEWEVPRHIRDLDESEKPVTIFMAGETLRYSIH